MGRGKGDDRDLSYYLRENRNYKGRPKALDHKLYQEALAIVENETIPRYEKFGIEFFYYMTLRDLTILKHFNIKPGLELPEKFSREARRQMLREVATLLRVMYAFLFEIERAKTENDQGFLETVKIVFSEYSGAILNLEGLKRSSGRKIKINSINRSYADGVLNPGEPRRSRGRKIKRDSIDKAYEAFLKWVQGDQNYIIPKTFYDREKPRALCVLAHKIYWILWQPLYATQYDIERRHAMKEVSLLLEKYDLRSSDVFLSVITQLKEHGIEKEIERLRGVEKVLLLLEKYDLSPSDVLRSVITRPPSVIESDSRWLKRRRQKDFFFIELRLEQLKDI